MKYIIILIALLITTLSAGERKSSTLDKARALIAKADTVLSQQAPSPELGNYTVASVDQTTGKVVKILVTPTVVAEEEGKTSTAMLMK